MAENLHVAPAETASLQRGRTHHYPALDGLRGLALLAVFTSHLDSIINPQFPLNWSSWLGVDVFFVLSGFLITGILYDSLGRPHYFRTFYIRRALRIFPLYYSIWIVFLILTPWVHPVWSRFDIARVFYYGNLMDSAAAHHPNIVFGEFLFYFPAHHLRSFTTGHLWSLCVEEQFYLVWPLLLFFLRDRVRIMRFCVIAIVVSLAANSLLTYWTLARHIGNDFLYDSTYTHVSPMFFGAWMALWLRGRPAGRPVAPAIYLSLIVLPLATICISLTTLAHRWPMSGMNPVVTSYGFTCSGLFGVGLVLAAIQQEGFLKRLFSLRWLAALGTISYGMYLIHGFLVLFFMARYKTLLRLGVPWLLTPVAFVFTLAIAVLSYRYFELPFLRLKDRLAPSRPVSISGRDPLAPPRKDPLGEAQAPA